MAQSRAPALKRVPGLWLTLTSFGNLLASAEAAAAGKRKRPDVAAFLLDLEPNLLQIRRQLLDGSYQPGPYRTFLIHEPKPREISAAPFRDRVVHHALTRVLDPIFEKRFSPLSFACRKGFGVHKALQVARKGCQQFPYVLKCDVAKYFASIDHGILQAKLARVVGCAATLRLAATIIASAGEGTSSAHPEVVKYFPGDDLFTPFERRRGLPLGNQTSQFFANVYLDALDQMVTRIIRPGCYARYVDDVVVFSDSKGELGEILVQLERKVACDRLCFHPRKSRIYRTTEGLTFLGWRIFPDRSRLVRANIAGFTRRLRKLHADFHADRVALDTVQQSVNAWIGHAAHGDTWTIRQRILERFSFATKCERT